MEEQMKFAVISDIHGHWMALQAILQDLEIKKCDEIYCLGDALAIGPSSAQCLSQLFNIPNLHFIRGNHEQYFVEGLSDKMGDGEKAHQQWVASQMPIKFKEVLRNYPFIK